VQVAAAKEESMMQGAAGLPCELLMKQRTDKSRMPPPAAQAPSRKRATKHSSQPTVKKKTENRKQKKEKIILELAKPVTVSELGRAPGPPQLFKLQHRAPRVPPARLLSDYLPSELI
jgi:hypothetical protein